MKLYFEYQETTECNISQAVSFYVHISSLASYTVPPHPIGWVHE